MGRAKIKQVENGKVQVGQSMAIHCKFFSTLFGNSHNKMLGKGTGEVFRDVVTLSLVVHKEFGLNPKMDRKPLKDFDGGGGI